MCLGGSACNPHHSGNKIARIDSKLLKMVSLKTLYLSNNRLHELPTEFQKLTKYAEHVFITDTIDLLRHYDRL
jgi:hypothetical protein